MIFDRHEKGNTIDIVLPFCFHIVYRYAHRKLNPLFEKILSPSFVKVNAAQERICYSSQIYKKRRIYAVYTNFKEEADEYSTTNS